MEDYKAMRAISLEIIFWYNCACFGNDVQTRPSRLHLAIDITDYDL